MHKILCGPGAQKRDLIICATTLIVSHPPGRTVTHPPGKSWTGLTVIVDVGVRTEIDMAKRVRMQMREMITRHRLERLKDEESTERGVRFTRRAWRLSSLRPLPLLFASWKNATLWVGVFCSTTLQTRLQSVPRLSSE